MNWGKTEAPAPEPKIGGVGSTDFSSTQQSVPVPWWIGLAPLPLTWIVPEPYNIVTTEIRQKVGKKKTTVGYDYYADVAGIAGLGLGRRLRWIESDGKIVWQGDLQRPDSPASPSYYAATCHTDVGTFYITWGRWNQPEDTILLGPLGARNPALRHPAYRGQIRVVIKRYYCGSSGTQVPNTRIGMEREPRPEVGSFPYINSDQGQSLVAGFLELATNPIFGAEIPADVFPAAAWEETSQAVAAAAGCHAPFIDRPSPLRDIAKDFSTYYDGFFRLEDGKIRPGFFPRNGTLPPNLATLGIHDFTERPATRATAVSAAFNSIVVTYRDRTNLFAETPANGSAADHVEAVDGHEPEKMDMLAIIDPAQAQRFADDAASLAAEGEEAIEGAILRTARAVHPGGEPLLPGDMAMTTILGLGVEMPVRVTRRVDPYQAEPELDFLREPGFYPQAPSTPPDTRPAIEVTKPQAIAQARVFELPADLAGTPIGLHIAVLAKRPISTSESGTMTAHNIIGFSIWYSPAGSSYDWLGSTTGWAVRGQVDWQLAMPHPDGSIDLRITLDEDNIDLSRIDPQSDTAREDNTLLLIIDDEVFSIGAITIDNYAYTFTCLRARCGTHATAHAAGAEAWIVFRDELARLKHATFASNQTRNFKLQPYAATALDLEDADPIAYHFRDRGPEAPQIEIDALPPSPKVGVAYQFKATIADTNGDLASWRMTVVRIVEDEIVETIQIGSGVATPIERAYLAARGMVTFPRSGNWQLVVTALDDALATTEARSALFAVATRVDGSWGDPLPGPPPVPGGLALAGGFESISISWHQSEAHTVASWDLCINAAPGQISAATETGLVGTSFALTPAPAGVAKYVRVRAVGANGIASEWSAEISGAALSISAAQLAQTAADLGTVADRLNDEIIEREAQAIATENALAGLQSTLEAHTTDIESLLEQTETFLSQLEANIAAITTEQQVRVTELRALARDLKNAVALYGDAHAVVQVLSEAFIDAAGNVTAKWGVDLDAGGTKASLSLIAKGGAQPLAKLVIDADMESANFGDESGFTMRKDGTLIVSRGIIRNSLEVNSLDPVSLDPPPCAFENPLTITPLVPPGLTLYMSIDGTPVSFASVRSGEWPKSGGAYTGIVIDVSTTLRARLYAPDGRSSDETIACYTRIGGLPQVSVPRIIANADGGYATHFTLECLTPGAAIYYQVAGGAAALYTGGNIAIGVDDYVTAYATKANYKNSFQAFWKNQIYTPPIEMLPRPGRPGWQIP